MIQRAPGAPQRSRRPTPRPGPWLALFGAGLLVRSLAAMLGASGVEPDARLETAARHLAAGQGLSLGAATSPVPTATLPPVAPGMLAGALRAVHDHPLALPALAIVLGALGGLAAARLPTGLH